MSQVEIVDAAADLQALVERVRGGEDVALAESGRVLARIVPADSEAVLKPPRRLGLAAGQFTLPEDFDAPLPDDVLALFYDGPIFPEPVQPDKDRA